MTVFDTWGPLPSGVTMLEASAGTGKTFTIAALAARYVAEGVPLQSMLLVTFTRMATGELRERVRERLVSAEQGLARALAGGDTAARDPLLAVLTDASAPEIEQRRQRLTTALADFDAATISTTHGFCQHVLSGLGAAGDVESDVTFVEEADDLLEEVVDDLYLRKFVNRGNAPFRRAEALRIAAKAIENPSAPIEPTADSDDNRMMRQRLASAARTELDVRKRRLKLITYDDLLTRLAETLRDDVRGQAACARLRQRYNVVLVDEFQDTDPTQWEIMRRAFGDGHSTLVLIGDPKQAIYSFRGADVYAYLDAAAHATTRSTLEMNWRSDQGLIDAYDALLRDASLGHEGIVYRRVRAAPANELPRLEGAPSSTPLRVRVVHREDGAVRLTPKEELVVAASGRSHIAHDLATDVVRLLSSDATIVTRDGDGSERDRTAILPRHVAVLVRTNRNAALIRDALEAVGVPAVINGAGSVFTTPVAREWLALVEALERPSSAARVRAVALACFVGWDAQRVVGADDAEWEEIHARLHRWAAVLRQRGVAALLELVTHSEDLPRRILGRSGGERVLTDLRHIGELLHVEMWSRKLGITALTAWLREQIRQAENEAQSEDRSRRLESDADAVQVLTIHRSKGLEFPVVYLPYLWEAGYFDDTAPVVFHDPKSDDQRTIDVGMSGASFAKHQKLMLEEQRGEDLRLAYVALTRAQHQAVVWWATGSSSENSPLGRLLFARDDDGNVEPFGHGAPHEEDVVAAFGEMALLAPGSIDVERATGGDGVPWARRTDDPTKLAVSRFERDVDERWRRTSYSGITASVHEPNVTSETEEPGLTDEDMEDDLPAPDAHVDAEVEQQLRSVAAPLAAMPGGAEVGSLVHAVFEHVDFAGDALETDLDARLADESSRRHVDVGDRGLAVGGLRSAIETPLGPVVGDQALRDVERVDRVDELGFELPLVGGDEPTADLTLDAIAGLLDAHLPPGDPLMGYAQRLRDPSLAQELQGYLVGSIDLVLRTHDADGTPRFTVVDYKTNWLGADGDELTAWDYRPDALADAMQRAHYPLQALIYTIALHRYLRWRQPGYDAAVNLAGVLYLFIRGMTGPDVPRVGDQPCGVFSWQPPPPLIEAMSDLFDRGATL